MRNFYNLLKNTKAYAIMLLFVLFAFVQNANAQCACAGTNYGLINVAGWTVGQNANQGLVYAGERMQITNTVAGAVYRVSTCGASYDSQLTVNRQHKVD